MAEDKPVKSEVAKREEEILKFWQENKIFEKSVAKEAPAGDFVFYDGPPFATGLPHFGHLLPTSMKDAVPRYQTMKGKRVLRRWGWDCHGLPIENLIEKELDLKVKKDIEDYGIDKFNEKARESVLRYASEWKKIIPRMGRWVDMENDYKTMNPTYTESVWWVFKNLYDKGLAYEGYKSMHLCPRCETTLANFEVNQGYRDVTDLSVTVKFELVDEPGTFLLAWTTTPWTLPGNVALAINPETNYVRIKTNDTNENYILAETRLSVLKDLKYEVVEKFAGKKLIGKKYKTVFDYYLKEAKVYGADFVTTEDGTGIVHIAPAFGEDDMALGEKEKLPFVQHVAVNGRFKPEVTDFAGQSVKPKSDDEKTRLLADINVIEYLKNHNTYFSKEKITHPYPHCWRCDTPLLNYASYSWFIKVTALKEKLLKLNSKITWVPEHIKEGRFGKWLDGARDWAVSRSRFWGAPLPVWRCEQCKEIKVVGGVEDLKKEVKTSNNYFLLRHGQAENNVTDVIDSQIGGNYHLTEKGRDEVSVSARKLKDKKIDLIIASDFVRTKETAELVAQTIGFPVEQIIFDSRLREVNVGSLNGGKWADFTKDKNIDGESLSDVKKRVGELLYELGEKYSNRNVLIVSHAFPLLCAEIVAKGLDEQATEIFRKERKDFWTGEMRELEFKPLPHNPKFELDFHRPYIDAVKLDCQCGGKMQRVPEVFDVWFESGSMPYGQLHYPFENQSLFKKNFPADFIAEGLDQTRGWFYVLLVLATGLFDETAYKNVVVNGLILAEDGRKMSKRFNNYPDLNLTIDKYGADALRFYLLSSPAVRAEEFNFSERSLGETSRRVLIRLKNVLSFYEMYADKKVNLDTSCLSENVLDKWILARLNQVIEEVATAMDKFEIDRALRPIDLFVDDLSTWYLRRSRDRLKTEAATIREVLLTFAKVLAPFTPFIAEDVYRQLGGEKESVHLEEWPCHDEADAKAGQIIEEMVLTRQLVSSVLEARAKAEIKIRQPLASLTIRPNLPPEFQELLKDELNVEKVMLDLKLSEEIILDTNITPELKEKGEVRDLIREIQGWRKEQNLKPGEKVKVPVPASKKVLAEKFAGEIMAATAASGFEFKD